MSRAAFVRCRLGLRAPRPVAAIISEGGGSLWCFCETAGRRGRLAGLGVPFMHVPRSRVIETRGIPINEHVNQGIGILPQAAGNVAGNEPREAAASVLAKLTESPACYRGGRRHGEWRSLLGDAMDMELEIEAVEHWVGAFKADILARVVGETDHRVIIENQFGRTNHGHLGQILTYLAGIEDAKTVVWIAESIQADHRAAVDWLNNNTTEQFSFFAIEIELWRIGNSPPAPRFNVIASPNDWTKAV